jgi:hypothetical protein
MHKVLLRSASLILAIALALGIFIPGRARSQNTTLMPNRIVNLAWFYKPPSNGDATMINSNFGNIVLTAGDETFRDQLVANGFASTIPQYYRSEAIQDPGSCTTAPYKNQVAYKLGDFCDISQNHADWFLLDTNGRRIVMSNNYYRMDPGNAGWRSFFVSRLIEANQVRGWSGVFLDNVEASLSKMQRDGITTARYSNDSSYQAAVQAFLQYLYVNYSQVYNRPVLANIIERSSSDEATWFSYMQYLSGAMQECWSVGWSSTSYLSTTAWNYDMALAERTQSQGKVLIAIAQGDQTDTNRQKFAFASYLLVSNGNASFRYANSSVYSQIWLYDNYNVQLGTPLGARYQSGTTWRRDFTNGYVIVDPASHTATISTAPAPTATVAPAIAVTNTATLLATPAVTRTPTTVVTNTPIQIATLVGTSTPTSLPANTSTAANAPSSTIYNDQNTAFRYSSGWTVVSDARAFQGEFKVTQTVNSSVTLNFRGQKFSIFYKTDPAFGSIAIYVDGNLIHTLNQNTSTTMFQQKWTYEGALGGGNHRLKLVFVGPSSGKVSLDAVSVP